jgi:hypothetical protein
LAEIPTTREEYYRELSALGVKTRRRLELRSEYYRTIAYIRWMPWRRDELLARARAIREAISILDEDIAYERERISRKVIKPPVKNKIIALHKRWSYKSPRGKHHDISIEAIATIIVPETERKEDYEDMLRDALEDYMYSISGFERLTDLSEEVVGFEEKPTDKPTRGVEIHQLEWWHTVPKTAQLKITDWLVP